MQSSGELKNKARAFQSWTGRGKVSEKLMQLKTGFNLWIFHLKCPQVLIEISWSCRWQQSQRHSPSSIAREVLEKFKSKVNVESGQTICFEQHKSGVSFGMTRAISCRHKLGLGRCRLPAIQCEMLQAWLYDYVFSGLWCQLFDTLFMSATIQNAQRRRDLVTELGAVWWVSLLIASNSSSISSTARRGGLCVFRAASRLHSMNMKWCIKSDLLISWFSASNMLMSLARLIDDGSRCSMRAENVYFRRWIFSTFRCQRQRHRDVLVAIPMIANNFSDQTICELEKH